MVRWLLLCISLALVIALFPEAVDARSTAQETISPILGYPENEELPVVVRIKGSDDKNLGKQDITKSKIRNELIRNHGASYEYQSQNAFNTKLTQEEIKELRKDLSLEIFIGKPVQKQLQDSADLINATSTWNLRTRGSNLTGSGQTVCVIDTGVDYAHSALGGCLGDGCKVIAGRNVIDNNNNITDLDGHGTHVAGIVAADGLLRGVAPEANIAGVKALNDTGSGSTTNIAAGIDWCANNAETYNISVISMSLGTSSPFVYSGACDGSFPAMATAISAAIAKNVTVISSSGNEGFSNNISAPACITGVIPVGSSTKNDQISSFSNLNSLVKLIAPGSLINSTVPGNAFSVKSGTSMAAPHVSGAYAILRQYLLIENLQNTTEELETLLFSTKGAALEENGNTYGRIDLFSAAKELLLAPITNASFPEGWQNESFNVTLEVTFNSTAINSTRYVLNESESEGTTITIDQEGNHTILFYSIDDNEIREDNRTINVLLDLSPPNTTIINQTMTWVAGPYALNFNASDTLSGVNMTMSNLSSSGSDQIFNTSTVTINDTGNYSLSYYSMDITGNEESQKNTTLLVDMTKPLLIIDSPLEWQNESFIINWSATDLHSGLNRTEYHLENQTVIATNLTINESGNWSVIIRATDQVNNTNESAITALLDLEAPNTTINAEEGWQDTNQTITFNATDDLSGINRTQTHLGDGIWTENSSLTLSDGNHTVSYRSIDVAGNVEEARNQTILIDTIAPITILSKNNSFPSENETIRFTVNVTETNIESVKLSIDGIEQNLSANNSIFTLDKKLEMGNHEITTVVRDRANNSDSQETQITIYKKKKLENVTISSMVIDARNETSSSLELRTNQTIQANVSILSSEVKPAAISPDLENIIRYVTIRLSENLQQNLSWAKLSVFYEEEISGLDETTLRLIYYNETSEEWQSLEDIDFIIETGSDEKEIWINTTRFSTYALVGDEPVVTTASSTSSGGGGGGGGGVVTSDQTSGNSSTRSIAFLNEGNPRTIDFDNDDLAIRSLTFTPGNALFSATFTLEKKEIPDDSPTGTRGYYELSYPTELIAQEVIIRYATTVPSPRLYRYSDGWYALEQEAIENGYLAYSDGLSRFAIVEETTREQQSVQINETAKPLTNKTQESPEIVLQPHNETGKPPAEPENLRNDTVLMTLLLLLVVLSVLYAYSKRSS